MDQAEEETDVSRISCNQKAQHRYLTWRDQKVGNFFNFVNKTYTALLHLESNK